LVGLWPQRQRLDQLLDELGEGRSGALVICGAGGSGKTLLLSHLAASAAGMPVLQLRGASSEVGMRFSGLHQLLSPVLGALADLPDARRQSVESAFGSEAGSTDRFQLGLGTLDLLSATASDAGVLCLVDDVQLVDPGSVETLAFVARRLDGEGIGLVFTERQTTAGGIAALRGLPDISVEPLDEAASRELLGLLGADSLDVRVETRILRVAGGNPLALRELYHGLTAAQRRGIEPLHERLPVTRRLSDSLLQEVHTLPQQAQAYLLIAALESDPTLVSRSAELLGIDPDAAGMAGAHELLRESDAVGFRSALLGWAVRARASASATDRAHQALAEVSDRRQDADRGAWHRACVTPGQNERVALQLERATERARTRNGGRVAAAFLERAAALTPQGPARARRLLRAAESAFRVGDASAALELVQDAEQFGIDGSADACARRLRAAILRTSGEEAQASRLLVEAASSAAPTDPSLAREIYLEALHAALRAGSPGAGAELASVQGAARGMTHHTGGQPSAADDLLDGYAALGRETRTEALAALRRGVDALRRRADLRWCGIGITAAWRLFDDVAIHELALAYVTEARRAEALLMLPEALQYLAASELLAGRLEDASAHVREAESVAEQAGRSTPDRSGYLLMIAGWRGEEAAGRQLALESIRAATAHGPPVMASAAQWLLAVLDNGLGNHAAALTAAQAACEDDWIRTWALPELVEAAVRTRGIARARAAASVFEEIAGPLDTPWARGSLACTQALVANGSNADELFQSSIEQFKRCSVVPQLGRARLLYGEWLRRNRRRRDAQSQLSMARQVFEAVGARAFGRRAEEGLRAAGAKPMPALETEPLDLTPQESQVARLVHDGLSNPEIAARLFISPRTVEYHLHKVFRKLDVTSRMQLARLVSDQPRGSEPPSAD
jgi:DNA-binding CsgD family transcriptional regulator/tetratricopeptide (TPR) repeat protein